MNPIPALIVLGILAVLFVWFRDDEPARPEPVDEYTKLYLRRES